MTNGIKSVFCALQSCGCLNSLLLPYSGHLCAGKKDSVGIWCFLYGSKYRLESIRGKVSGWGKDVKYLEVRLKFPAGNWGGGPKRAETQNFLFRHVSSLFLDTFELFLQELCAVCCLYLELKENGEFLSKITETKVFGKCQCAFEKQNLPPGFFLILILMGKSSFVTFPSILGRGNFVP